MISKKLLRIAAAAAAMLLLPSGPTEAGDGKVRFGLAWSGPSGGSDTLFIESSAAPGGTTVYGRATRTEVADGIGLRLDWEIPVSPRFGLDVGASRVRHDLETALSEQRGFLPSGGTLTEDFEPEESGSNPAETVARIDMIVITAGVFFHPVRDERFDFFLGPQLAFVQYGNLETAVSAPEWFPGETGVKNDLTHGALAGFDWELGRTNWFFSGSIQYVHTDAVLEQPGGGLTLPVEAWFVHAGVGYRFRGNGT